MRITIGGALLFASAGGMAVVGPVKMMSPSVVTSQVSGIQQTLSWVGSYFKGGQPVETVPIDLPSTETRTETPPALPAAPVADPPQGPAPTGPVAVLAAAAPAQAVPEQAEAAAAITAARQPVPRALPERVQIINGIFGNLGQIAGPKGVGRESMGIGFEISKPERMDSRPLFCGRLCAGVVSLLRLLH